MCLTSRREQIEVCVEVLGRILQAQDPALLFHARKAELESGLEHPDDTVKLLTLTQVDIHMNKATLHVPLLDLLTCIDRHGYKIIHGYRNTKDIHFLRWAGWCRMERL